jgi:hypothetical protein
MITFLFTYGAGVEPSQRPIYRPWMIDGNDFGAISEKNDWQRKPKYSEETCLGTALPTTDLT